MRNGRVDEPECVLEVKTAQERLPGAVDFGGGGARA
jgi:hypothetical protein